MRHELLESYCLEAVKVGGALTSTCNCLEPNAVGALLLARLLDGSHVGVDGCDLSLWKRCQNSQNCWVRSGVILQRGNFPNIELDESAGPVPHLSPALLAASTRDIIVQVRYTVDLEGMNRLLGMTVLHGNSRLALAKSHSRPQLHPT